MKPVLFMENATVHKQDFVDSTITMGKDFSILPINLSRVKNILFIIILSGLLMALFSSCLKDDSEEQKAEERKTLENYIRTHNILVEPTESGLYYIETLEGTGPQPEDSMWMEIQYTGSLVSSGRVVMTSDKDVAVENDIYSEGIYYGPTRLIQGLISYQGLNEGIGLMKEGGKARLIFPSDLGLGSQSSSFIPAYSSLIFDIELLKVIPDVVRYENELMLDYLESAEMSIDSTSSGIYYKELTEGTGDFPITGNHVEVTYTGHFLNGVVFDQTTKPRIFQIGYNELIPGFEEALKLMREGGSSMVVIPYYHAYGQFGRVDLYYRTVIPPFSTLVFTINLSDISK